MESQRGRRGPLENRSYLNDDYNKYAGADYHESSFGSSRYDEYDRSREQQRRQRGDSPHHFNQDASHPDARDGQYQRPGVSGKSREQGSWINEKQYATQKSFIGKGPKGYQREDARIHEDVCEALSVSPQVDASDIEVSVQGGVIQLSGTVDSRHSKKEAERVVENIAGVIDVQNELRVDSAYNEIISQGPSSVTQNDREV